MISIKTIISLNARYVSLESFNFKLTNYLIKMFCITVNVNFWTYSNSHGKLQVPGVKVWEFLLGIRDIRMVEIWSRWMRETDEAPITTENKDHSLIKKQMDSYHPNHSQKLPISPQCVFTSYLFKKKDVDV